MRSISLILTPNLSKLKISYCNTNSNSLKIGRFNFDTVNLVFFSPQLYCKRQTEIYLQLIPPYHQSNFGYISAKVSELWLMLKPHYA